MNFRYFFWILPWLSLISPVQAVELEEQCIEEPVFSGKVCVYQANREADRSIFFIHGLGDNASRDWERQIAALGGRYHIITFDLPGFGRSEQGDKAYSPEKYAELIDYLAEHYAVPRFTLVGHSMGAAVSLLYASRHPQKVERLVVVDVAGILHRLAIGKYVLADAASGHGRWSDTLESYAVKVIEKFEGIFSILREDIAMQSEHVRAGIELVDYDFGPVLDSLQSQTLIIWGREDGVAPLRTAKVLHQRIAHSQLEVIDGAGHLPMVDKSGQFNALLLDFIQGSHSAEPPPRLVASGDSHGEGQCNGQRWARFSGNYERLEIVNCSGVTISDATVGELLVRHSRVVIEDSRIGGDSGVAVEATGSDIKMTTSTISGDVALKAAGSRFDLAAVDIHANSKAVVVTARSRLIFSVSRLFSSEVFRRIHQHLIMNRGDVLS